MEHTFYTLGKIFHDKKYEYHLGDVYRFYNFRDSGIVYDERECPLKSFELDDLWNTPYYTEMQHKGFVALKNAESLIASYLAEGDTIKLIGYNKKLHKNAS